MTSNIGRQDATGRAPRGDGHELVVPETEEPRLASPVLADEHAHDHDHPPIPAAYENAHIPTHAWTDPKMLAKGKEIFTELVKKFGGGLITGGETLTRRQSVIDGVQSKKIRLCGMTLHENIAMGAAMG